MSLIKKKRHVSKKNKKDWRKHCDITDVEQFLDEQRLDERLGNFSTKPDSELFVIDTAGTDTVVKVDEKPLITNKHRKRGLLSEVPKCFEVLLPSSKVQDPNAKRNHVNPVGSGKTALSKITDKRKLKNGAFEKRLELAKKNRKMALDKKRKMKQCRHNFSVDIWGENSLEAKGIPETLQDEFVSTDAQLHNVLPLKRLRPKPPLAKKLQSTPAVALPHPGVSYNPSFKEHQELLQEVVQTEEKMIKKEQHLHRVTTRMFSKLTPAQKEEQWRAEMKVGTETEEKAKKQDEDKDTDNEYRAINPPVQNKKKDHKARRKQKERLAELERLKREKINKKKNADLYRLRKLQSSIDKKEVRETEHRTLRVKKRSEKEMTATPALSAHKVAKVEPDFVEPTTLSGDLRNISTTTNLLRERYQSLQRRGAIAGAKLMMKKKRKLKSYFKSGHKVTDKDVDKYINNPTGKGPLRRKV